MLKARHQQYRPYGSDGRRPSLVSILSGKGGVGKSVIAFNLAERLATHGGRVLLVDADFGGGNQHVLANVDCRYGLLEFVSHQLSLTEAVTELRGNLDLLAMPTSSIGLDVDLSQMAAGFVTCLREELLQYDFVVIDHSSGLTEVSLSMALTSDLNLLVMVPELTSINDAYGLLKHLVEANRQVSCQLLVNRILESSEADYIKTKFTALSERFLSRRPGYVGSLSEDDAFRRSVAAQKPVAEAVPDAKALSELNRIAQTIVNQATIPPSGQSDSHKKQINVLPATADTRE